MNVTNTFTSYLENDEVKYKVKVLLWKLKKLQAKQYKCTL